MPALLYRNLPLDLIEALTYGREWQLGYDKLPPLPWWLVETAYRLFGHDAAYYALGQLSVVTAYALVWTTARSLIGARAALIAILIIDGLHYFHFTAAKFNHDVVQLPLWALAGYSFHAALRRSSTLSWVLLGLAIGLAVWAKYFVVVLAAPLVLFLLIDPEARKSLAQPGPWIGAVVAVIAMAPHVVWLVQNDFVPLAHVNMRAAPSHGPVDHLWHPAVFAAGQLFFLLPALLIAVPLIWPRRTATPGVPSVDGFDRRIVSLLAFGPVATVLALSLVSGRGTIAMWGYPLWLFLGLWIVLFSASQFEWPRARRIVVAWAGVFTVFILAFVADYAILPGIDHRSRAVLFPGERLASELTHRFHDATGQPLAYVIGSMWDGGNVAHYSPEQPHPRVLIDGSPARTPWIDPSDIRTKGAIVVWTDKDASTLPANFAAVAANAEIGTPFGLQFARTGKSVRVGWAIIRPKNSTLPTQEPAQPVQRSERDHPGETIHQKLGYNAARF